VLQHIRPNGARRGEEAASPISGRWATGTGQQRIRPLNSDCRSPVAGGLEQGIMLSGPGTAGERRR
jgi:hypothetical protein